MRLVGAAAAVADDARKGGGTLLIVNGPKMSQRACRDLFQDLVSLSNLEVLLPARDPGDVPVRWRGRQELRLLVRSGEVHMAVPRAGDGWPLCSARRAEPDEMVNDTRMPDSRAVVSPLDLRNAPSAAPLDAKP